MGAPSSAKAGNTTLEESTKATISSNASTTSSVNITKSNRGLNSSVTISEAKKTSDVVEVISSETLNPATQKLFNERFEAFKQYCVGVDGKPDPVFAGEKTIAMFLNSLAQKKNMNKSVQEGYRQAILKVQAMKKEERKTAEPRSTATQPSAPTRSPAPRQPAPAATTATTQRPPAPRVSVPRQSATNIRQTTAPAAPRQAGPTIQQVTPRPQQAAPRSRQVAPNPRQSNPAPRQPAPRQTAPRGAATTTPTIRQQSSSLVQGAQHTQLPSFLTRQVSFPCRLELNSGGGESLYRAAAQHAGLGQGTFKELRRYCHVKLAEWWQWYEPYYAFPIQVKLKMKSATVQRNIPTPAAFLEFLKSDDSLLSWNVSECETYCLANVLGVAVHQLTYNLAGQSKEKSKWDVLEPHQGLVHQNKFVMNKEPLYVLHEDKVVFTRIVKANK